MERHKLLNQMKGRYRLPPEIYKRSFQLNNERIFWKQSNSIFI